MGSQSLLVPVGGRCGPHTRTVPGKAAARTAEAPSAAWLSFRSLFFAGLLLRLTLLAVGEYQDRHFPVKYTDIDYVVFTDAARHVVAGESPYARATYRYTPLLAWLMTPNVVWFRSFGKIVLVAADMVVGIAMEAGLEDRGVPRRTRLLICAATWMLNPVVANISTRGSAESLLGAIVLVAFRCLTSGRLTLAALLFGFAVHFRIYPIVYAAPILMYLEARGKPPASGSRGVIGKAVWFVGPARVRFAIISGGTFVFLAATMYLIYGHEFLQETYLYHVSRRDHRHNFSPWFYDLYLSSSPAAGNSSAVADFAARHLGLFAFVPQMGTVALLGFAYGKEDLYFAAFAQTFAFVTWNKVCTSQYFMWYMCLLPFDFPSLHIRLAPKGLLMLLSWIGGQAIWLSFAYKLEFLGQNTFFELWLSGIAFFSANAWILLEFIENHRPAASDSAGNKRMKPE